MTLGTDPTLAELLRGKRRTLGILIAAQCGIIAAAHSLGLGWLGQLVGVLPWLALFAAAESPQQAHEKLRRQIYGQLERRLENVEGVTVSGPQAKGCTHLQVQGRSTTLSATSAEESARREYCKLVHFEFTLNPASLVYGLHFELADAKSNEDLASMTRKELDLDAAGYEKDNHLPKKPEWRYIVRTIPLPEKESQQLVLEHVQHFEYMVRHNCGTLYGDLQKRYLNRLSTNDATCSALATVAAQPT